LFFRAVVDAGIGAIIKDLMASLTDAWLASDEALSAWCKPVTRGGLGRPSQRVLMALWASAAWKTLSEKTNITEMFHKTGCALTVAGAINPETAKPFDMQVRLEGFSEEQLTELRARLLEKPPKVTHASIADMLYAECQISQLTQMCKDAGLPVGVDKDLTLKQSLAKRLADDGWGGDESMESEIEAVNADSRADDGNDGDDHGDDGYEQKICEAESEDLDGTADMHNQQQHGVEAATLQDFVADTCEDHCVCVAVYRTPRVEDLIVYRSGLQWQLGEVSSVTIGRSTTKVEFDGQTLETNATVCYSELDIDNQPQALTRDNYIDDIYGKGRPGQWCLLQHIKLAAAASAPPPQAAAAAAPAAAAAAAAAPAPAAPAPAAATQFQHGETVDLVGNPMQVVGKYMQRVRKGGYSAAQMRRFAQLSGFRAWCCAEEACTSATTTTMIMKGQGVQCVRCSGLFHRRSCGENCICRACL
jgi:hypothetical protein